MVHVVRGHQYTSTMMYSDPYPRPSRGRVHDISRDLSFAPRRAHRTRTYTYVHASANVAYYCIQRELITYPAGEIEDFWPYGGVLVNRFPRLDQWPARSSAEWQKLPQICVNLVPSIAHFHLCCFPTINPQKYMRSKYLKNHTLISR